VHNSTVNRPAGDGRVGDYTLTFALVDRDDLDLEVTVRSASTEKGWLAGDQAFQVLSGDTLAIAMSRLPRLIDCIPPITPNDGWALDEIRLTVEITAEGGLRLVGAIGLSVGGGIEVTLKRKT
jgi:hypothetical protein